MNRIKRIQEWGSGTKGSKNDGKKKKTKKKSAASLYTYG